MEGLELDDHYNNFVSDRCAFDYRTGEVISPVPDALFSEYVESLDGDPIGAVPGDDWGFPDRLIFMW
jgi:hypothetical protein